MPEYRTEQKLMGSHFSFGIFHDNAPQAKLLLVQAIDEIKRLEELLSEFLPDSETTKINNLANTEPVSVSRECFDLITRSQHISQLTKGCFDITVSPLKRIYSFKNGQFNMPEEQVINEAKARTGYNNVILNEKDLTISFSKPGMHISFAAIGKGYASDMVKKMWLEHGVTSGYINASGDLNTFGFKPNGDLWKVGIADPDDKSKILLKIPVSNVSLATSGDSEQHFIFNGRRYSHNIDPHSGLPISGIKSVSVISPAAELSDALATAVYVKGIKEGISFVDQLPQTHAIIIDDKNEIYFSKEIQFERVH